MNAHPKPKANLDARGLFCPMPILKASQMLETLGKGEVLEVLADDPAAPSDFVAFAKRTGNLLLANEEKDGTYRFVLEHK
jgi:tRNA 2-thiouridine synthesizing protein A